LQPERCARFQGCFQLRGQHRSHGCLRWRPVDARDLGSLDQNCFVRRTCNRM
jgi:hypothetical protein